MKYLKLFEEYEKTHSPYSQIKDLDTRGVMGVDNVYQLAHIEHILSERGI